MRTRLINESTHTYDTSGGDSAEYDEARSAAIYKLLQMKNWFKILNDKNEWAEFHLKNVLG